MAQELNLTWVHPQPTSSVPSRGAVTLRSTMAATGELTENTASNTLIMASQGSVLSQRNLARQEKDIVDSL